MASGNDKANDRDAGDTEKAVPVTVDRGAVGANKPDGKSRSRSGSRSGSKRRSRSSGKAKTKSAATAGKSAAGSGKENPETTQAGAAAVLGIPVLKRERSTARRRGQGKDNEKATVTAAAQNSDSIVLLIHSFASAYVHHPDAVMTAHEYDLVHGGLTRTMERMDAMQSDQFQRVADPMQIVVGLGMYFVRLSLLKTAQEPAENDQQPGGDKAKKSPRAQPDPKLDISMEHSGPSAADLNGVLGLGL